jgi:3-hydroxyacyl-[acyl-carrier-protein] dehydratase
MTVTTPLVDLATLKLDRVIHGREELYRVLKQRGTFALLDGVLYEDEAEQLVVGYKDVRADEWWAADHIPGRPLFPGALMVEAAAQLSSYDFQRRSGDPDKFVGFAGIDRARFRAPVEPPCRMILACRAIRVRRSLFLYRCQGFVEGRLVFETEISGMVV